MSIGQEKTNHCCTRPRTAPCARDELQPERNARRKNQDNYAALYPQSPRPARACPWRGGRSGRLAGPATPLEAQSAAPPPPATVAAPSEAFAAAKVADLARALAAEAHKPPTPSPLDALGSVTPEEIAAIRYRPAELIWAADNLAFAIEPLHRSRNFPGEMELYTVEGGTASRLAYDPARFDFGKLKPPPASAQLGFTGFRVLHRAGDGKLKAVASLLNASMSPPSPTTRCGVPSRAP